MTLLEEAFNRGFQKRASQYTTPEVDIAKKLFKKFPPKAAKPSGSIFGTNLPKQAPVQSSSPVGRGVTKTLEFVHPHTPVYRNPV